MLKKRIIATVLLKNELVVQSIGFKKFLPIGKLDIVLQFLEKWDIDEVIILDIDASKENRTINFDLIKQASSKIFVPLTIGGGISSIKEIEQAIHSGADKVSINTTYFENKDFIKQASKTFGKQCIVMSADVKKDTLSNNYFVYNKGIKSTLMIDDWIKDVVDLGCGEVLINSIDKDGSKLGYDLDLMKDISDKLKIPLIALGGAGKSKHIHELFSNSTVDAAAIGNMLYFTEHSTSKIKSFLLQKNNKLRLNHFVNYDKIKFNDDGRIEPIEHKSIFIKD
jgi:cyclase